MKRFAIQITINYTLKTQVIIVILLLTITMMANAQISIPSFPNCDEKESQHIVKNIDSLWQKSKILFNTDIQQSFCSLLNATHFTKNAEQKTALAHYAQKKSKILFTQAQYKIANSFAGLAYHIWVKLNNPLEQINTSIDISNNYYYIGDLYNAIVFANKALDLSKKQQLYKQEYRSINALAWCYWKIENYKKAKEYISYSRGMIKANIVDDNLINYYNAMANLHDKQKEYKLAIKYNDSAISLSHKYNNHKMLALCVSNKASFMIKSEGNIDSILNMTKQAIQINKKMHDQEQLSSNLALLSKSYLYQKNYDKAIYWAKQGLKIATKIDRKPNEILDYLYLENAYFNKGDYLNAHKYLEKYTNLYKQLYKPLNIIKIFDMQQQNAEAYHNSIIENLKKEKEIISIKNEKNRHSLIYTSVILILIILGIISYFVYKRNYRKRKNEAIQKKLEYNLIKMEMEALRAKMNPHFIFNSLNSINSFIATSDTNSASKYLVKFASLIRLILKHSKHKLIPLSDEMKAIQYYIDLEMVRLKNKFDFCLQNKESIDLTKTLIPPSIVQPFIENAIWHGITSLDTKGLLCIDIYTDKKYIIIDIEDNGIGRKKAQKYRQKSHIPISTGIIKKTVEAFKNDEDIELVIDIIDKININNKSEGTKVRIKIRNKHNI